MKEQFKKWFDSLPAGDHPKDGEEWAWEAWQAAERQALERAVKRLESTGDLYQAELVRALIDAQSGEDQK